MSVDAPNTAAEQGPEILTPDVFREFMSSYPSGVTIVTTYDHDGAPRGFTCSSMCSVTMEPPTLLLCVNTRSTTLDAVHDCTRFAVNLLHSGGVRRPRLFLRSRGPLQQGSLASEHHRRTAHSVRRRPRHR